MIRLAALLFATFGLYGCPVYPALQNPNIDYNGRWSEAGDGNVLYNPNEYEDSLENVYQYQDSLQNMYQESDGTYGSAYDDGSGDAQ
jgi:hypothetical protein